MDPAEKRPKIVPRQQIEDTLVVPEKEILMIPMDAAFANPADLFKKLESKRSWFTGHFYKCLPLVFGNQHGFALLSPSSFVVRWNGGEGLDAISIHTLEPESGYQHLVISSHFGSGILTLQSRYIFRTAPGVNLMVKEPPNYPIDGFSWMNAVVETDNLRRDFTFNIKITRPHQDIYVPKGTPVGCLVPYPRFFLDDYKMTELKDEVELNKARITANYFGEDRARYGSLGQDYRYMEGVDVFGCPFKEHQKTLDDGAWWDSRQEDLKKERLQDDLPEGKEE